MNACIVIHRTDVSFQKQIVSFSVFAWYYPFKDSYEGEDSTFCKAWNSPNVFKAFLCTVVTILLACSLRHSSWAALYFLVPFLILLPTCSHCFWSLTIRPQQIQENVVGINVNLFRSAKATTNLIRWLNAHFWLETPSACVFWIHLNVTVNEHLSLMWNDHHCVP